MGVIKEKKVIVIGIVLIIFIVAAGIAYQNYGYAQLAKKQVNALNIVIQQKNIEIAKLTKEVKAKQDELSGVRAELESIKKISDNANTQINNVVEKVVEQPVIQEPQSVNK